jgi:hypothetical protein
MYYVGARFSRHDHWHDGSHYIYVHTVQDGGPRMLKPNLNIGALLPRSKIIYEMYNLP